MPIRYYPGNYLDGPRKTKRTSRIRCTSIKEFVSDVHSPASSKSLHRLSYPASFQKRSKCLPLTTYRIKHELVGTNNTKIEYKLALVAGSLRDVSESLSRST